MPEDFAALDAALNAFDNPSSQTTVPQAAPAVETPPTNEPVETPEETPAAPAADTTSDPAPAPVPEAPAAPVEPEPTEPVETIFAGEKQNSTFAKMRVENTRLNRVVGRLGQLIGLDASDPERLAAALEQRLAEAEANASNIPVDVANRLAEAERRQQEYEQALLRTNADLAFQKVKDSFNLTNGQLTEFAKQLVEEGKNPYLAPMDLVAEYRNLNFDKILAAERAKLEKEFQARQEKAATQSVAPPKAVGAPASPQQPVTSVTQLEQLLNQMPS